MATSCSPAPSASPAGSADSPWSWQSPAARPPPCRPARCAAGRPARSSCARPTPHSTRVPPGSVPRSAPSLAPSWTAAGCTAWPNRRETLLYVLSKSWRQQTRVPAATQVRLRFGHRAPLSLDLSGTLRSYIEHTAARQVFHRQDGLPQPGIGDCGRGRAARKTG